MERRAKLQKRQYPQNRRNSHVSALKWRGGFAFFSPCSIQYDKFTPFQKLTEGSNNDDSCYIDQSSTVHVDVVRSMCGKTSDSLASAKPEQ